MLHALKDVHDHLKAAHDRRRQLQEIDALDDRAIEELGLTREELREVITVSAEVRERMAAMAARHGLDRTRLEDLRQDYVHLLDVCAHCDAAGKCAEYLADESRGPTAAGFCPNHADYLALREV
jgi:uncharacterized protein YjiS (DUF1127 family)